MDQMPYMPPQVEYSYLLTSFDGQYVVTFLDSDVSSDALELHALNVYAETGGTEPIVNITQRYARMTGTGMGMLDA